MEDIQFDETTNTFVMTDDLLMAFLSTKKFRAKVANPLIDLANAVGDDSGNKEEAVTTPTSWNPRDGMSFISCHSTTGKDTQENDDTTVPA